MLKEGHMIALRDAAIRAARLAGALPVADAGAVNADDLRDFRHAA